MNRRFINRSILIPLFLTAGICLLNIYFFARHGRLLINSDNALNGAKVLNEAHALFVSDAWLYPTQMFMTPVSFLSRLSILLFPDNWVAAHIFEALSYHLVLIGCNVYLFRQMNNIPAGLWTSFATLCPVGILYARMAVWFPIYMTYVIHITFSVALVLHQRKAENKKTRMVLLVLSLALALFHGLSGVRMPMIVYMPLFVSALFLYLFDMPAYKQTAGGKTTLADAVKGTLHTESFAYAVITLLHGVMSGVGLYICNHVLAKQYSFRTYTTFSIKLKKIGELLDDFLSLFGETKEITTFNLHYAAYWLGQILVISALILIIRYSFEKHAREQLSVPEQRWLLFFLSGFLVCIVVYGNAWDLYSGGGWYFLHLMPQVYACVFLILSHMPQMKQLICLGYLVITLLTGSVSSMKNPWIPGQADARGLTEIADFLVAEGYTQGMATFWHSNVMTDLTSGKIEMWTLGTFAEDFTNAKMYAWMQKRSHLEALPEGRVFVLFNGPELAQFDYSVIWDHAIWVGDDFVVFAFDDVKDYTAAVGTQ